jgi:DNA-directed RNA polymerase subunit RPC12/RpoP/anti-anti-sigma regulatory factor
MAPETTDFTYRVNEKSNEVSIVIAGTLDEASEMPVPDVRGRRVVIDAHGVARANSMGVRAWIEMMTELSARTSDIVVSRVPAVLMTQASMISTFFGSARIESFMTPWICLNCDNSLEQIHGGGDQVPQAIQCPKCGSAMELDWDREAYLKFRGG